MTRYSKGGEPCSANSCEYAVTYKDYDGVAEFEMTSRASWMAIGFSSDKSMVRVIYIYIEWCICIIY